MEDGIAIVISLIGAAIGGLGGTFVGYFLQEKRRKQKINELMVKQYLSQFQNFSESLWFRFHNIMFKRGINAMNDDYFKQTTLYALASFLAYKWIMTLEGINAQIELLEIKLDDDIKKNIHISGDNLEEIGKSLFKQMYYYDKRSLAESVLEKKDGVWMISKFIDFKKKYFDEKNNSEIDAGKNLVEKLGEKRPEGETEKEIYTLMDDLVKIVFALEKITQVSPAKKVKNTSEIISEQKSNDSNKN